MGHGPVGQNKVGPAQPMAPRATTHSCLVALGLALGLGLGLALAHTMNGRRADSRRSALSLFSPLLPSLASFVSSVLVLVPAVRWFADRPATDPTTTLRVTPT
jgi:hypothetical protein